MNKQENERVAAKEVLRLSRVKFELELAELIHKHGQDIRFGKTPGQVARQMIEHMAVSSVLNS